MRIRLAVVGVVAAGLTLAAGLSGAHSAPTHTSGCVDNPGTFFNECATLDSTQVQDRRLRWDDGMLVCLEEDGSTPGQGFPCRWESAREGNGRGHDYVLTRAA